MKINGKFYSFFLLFYLIYFKILLVQNLPLLKKVFQMLSLFKSTLFFFSAVLERFPVKKGVSPSRLLLLNIIFLFFQVI